MLIIYSDQIKIHDSSSFEGMRVVGKLAAELLDLFVHQVKPGITTDTLDSFAYEFILDNKWRLAIKDVTVDLKAKQHITIRESKKELLNVYL